MLVGNQQNNRVTVQAPSASGTQYTPVQTLGGSRTRRVSWRPATSQWAVPRPSGDLARRHRREHGQQRRGGLSHHCRHERRASLRPRPQTYFVGTAPASVTVADINGDGIPDMLIANQGSNDVSVIFGSYDANGDWVGIARAASEVRRRRPDRGDRAAI